MQASKEKLKNMASAAKEQVDIYKAKIDEKADVALARTEVEKEIAHDLAKAKEAKARMELHEARARHAAEKLNTKKSSYYAQQYPPVGTQTQTQTQHQPLGAVPMPGATHLSYPPGGNPPINKHI